MTVAYSNNVLAGIASATGTYAGDLNHFGSTNTKTFTIIGYTLLGFYQPVDRGMVNTVKGGSTVPLKFEIFQASTELTSVGSVASFKTTKVNCAAFSDELSSPVDITSTGGTTLRYDSTSGQFIQNWQTPKTANACYVVTMTTIDGAALVANFKLK